MAKKTIGESREKMLKELVKHFRESRELLRREWVKQMTAKGLLGGLKADEIENESARIYDTCVNCLETGKYEDAQTYAGSVAERAVLRNMTTEQVIGGFLTLRDVYGRSLFMRYQGKAAQLNLALSIYEPVANGILTIVAMAYIKSKEMVVIQQQQEAIRELSTPVLQVREGLLILPIIGMIDTQRARQLTEQLLSAIRAKRAKIAVLDITGVPTIDSKVANHLLQTVTAARLMGANILVTGLSPQIAQTIVSIGVDLSKVTTLADLQSGIDEADKLLGYKVTKGEQIVSKIEG